MRIKKKSKKILNILKIFEESCLVFFKIQITSWQKKIAHEIIWRTLLRKRHTIILSCCRQIGKTEIVCLCEWFLSYWFPLEEKERYRVVFTAPERSTKYRRRWPNRSLRRRLAPWRASAGSCWDLPATRRYEPRAPSPAQQTPRPRRPAG